MSQRNDMNIYDYNKEEEFMYSKTYLFIKGYATGRNLTYTLKALPLARKIHNGQYRKGTVEIDGKQYQLPYLLHVLKVASTLISLHLDMTDEELDLLITCALLHDAIEDNSEFFQFGGKELSTDYGFPLSVYDILRLLSKRSGATEEELKIYFDDIKKSKIAALIKMADRSHNVEDLYNMKTEKLHKYVKETRTYIYPMASYMKENYPELSNGVTILKAKIVSLTELTETIVGMYEEKIKLLTDELKKKGDSNNENNQKK